MNKPEYRIWPVKKSNSRWHAYQNHDLTCRIVRVYDSMEPPRVKSWLESKTECNQVSLRRLMRVNVDLWVCTEFAGLGKMEMASVRLFRFSLFLTTLHQYRSASIKSFFFLPPRFVFSCSLIPSRNCATIRLQQRRRGAHAWWLRRRWDEVWVGKCAFLPRLCECMVAATTMKCMAVRTMKRVFIVLFFVLFSLFILCDSKVRWPKARFSSFPLLFVGLPFDWRIL